MERIAVLVASSPASPSARGAFQIIRNLTAEGHAVTLGLLEDGVLGATGHMPEVPLADCVSVLVLATDLTLRGYSAESLHPDCQLCNYGDIVDLMMVNSDRTLGTF